MQSTLEAILAQLSGRNLGGGGGGSASNASTGLSPHDPQPSPSGPGGGGIGGGGGGSHVSPASSSSLSHSGPPSHPSSGHNQYHHPSASLAIAPNQLAITQPGQLGGPQQAGHFFSQNQQQGQGPSNLLAGGPGFAFGSSGSASGGGGLSFTPSGALSMGAGGPGGASGGGIPTSAYSPINLASPSFGAHLFPGTLNAGGESSSAGGGGSLSDVRSDWLPTVQTPGAVAAAAAASLLSANHSHPLFLQQHQQMQQQQLLQQQQQQQQQQRESMAPPPLPDFLRRGGRPGSSSAATAGADSGYRADTEDAFTGASGGRRPFKTEPATSGSLPGEGNKNSNDGNAGRKRPRFPELPGFAPPETHAFAPYEIVPSTAVSSEGRSCSRRAAHPDDEAANI
jgi:hypothetical protein